MMMNTPRALARKTLVQGTQDPAEMVTEIDRQRTGNLSSAIRTYVLLDAVSD